MHFQLHTRKQYPDYVELIREIFTAKQRMVGKGDSR